MKTTLAPMWHDLMDAPSLDNLEHTCVICGRPATDKHHIVPRSAGKYFDQYGREKKKPTVRLCGSGNTSGCHGLAHQHRLHFRYLTYEEKRKGTFPVTRQRLEYLITDEPCDRLTALEMDGWRKVNA